MIEEEKGKHARYLASVGSWVSGMLWPPAESVRNVGSMRLYANIVGWVPFFAMAYWAFGEAGRRRWIWIGMIVFCLVLATMRATPVGRYFALIAPLIVLGAWLGFERLGDLGAAKAGLPRRLVHAVPALFVASILIVNLPLYGINVWVVRSPDFSQQVLAGQFDAYARLAAWMREHQIQDGVVSVGVASQGKGRISPINILTRNIDLLTGGVILAKTGHEGMSYGQMIRTARAKNIDYYLYLPPINPWRIWHFRVPWLQEFVTGKPAGEATPYVELYDLRGEVPQLIELPSSPGPLRRIPGLKR
jgi:hypothetical protein